jgi:hydroxyethylthiazole kinase-like uncharacterized protein yjeF
MIKVFTVAEMVAAEKAADAAGNSYDQMMETAGKRVAQAIVERFPIADQKVTILVGPGNNGGDGLVAGRHLSLAGAEISFYMFRERDPAQDHNLAKAQEMGLNVVLADYDQRFRVLRHRLQITDILIDALLGTGVSKPITGKMADLMGQVQAALMERNKQIDANSDSGLISVSSLGDEEFAERSEAHLEISNTSRRPIIVSVDCPSGLNCDTGQLDKLALPAHISVTFAGPKRGHYKFPGAAAVGELIVADIGIGPKLTEVSSVLVEAVTYRRARELLPIRPAEGHKGTFGWILIAAGSSRYWGAAALAGRAAYRSGAGLVGLAVPATIRPALATQLPEATYPPMNENEVLGVESAKSLLDELELYQALLVGPGLYKAAPFLDSLLSIDNIAALPPLVVDADGLNLLADLPDWPERLPADTILTPHPGEMARLMGVKLNDVKESDRIELALDKASKWQCVLLLKGAYTVVAAPDGRAAILPFANPALATAGSGDVLSGIIVALLGQGMRPYEAAILGGYLHGAAGTLPGVEAGILAGEIADWIPEVWETLRD